jgi:iron complex outermembrane receptor protein
MTGVAVTALAVVAAGSAQAQDSRAPARDPEASGQLEELVVTARRREESQQAVPVAVSTFSADAIEKRSIVDLRDMAGSVPNLQISQNTSSTSAATVTLRGQATGNISISFDPAVGVYFDEVYLGRTTGNLLGSMQDIASVEVLRGVQGTLFGRNNTGGAIVLTPKRPNLNEVEGELGLNFGNLNLQEIEGVLNLPIVQDKFAIRASLTNTDRDGFQSSRTTGIDTFADKNRTSGRIGLRVVPIDEWTIDFTYDFSQLDETGMLNGNTNTGNLDVSNIGVTNPVTTGDIEGYTLNTVYDAGAVQYKLIAGYRRLVTFDISDIDGGPSQATDYSLRKYQRQWTGEFNASGTLFENENSFLTSLDWVAGVFYFWETGVETRFVPWSATPVTGGRLENTATNDSVAAYAQVEANLANRLSIFAGARYTQDNREAESGVYRFGACSSRGLPANTPLTDCYLNNSIDFDYWSWTVGARYQITDDAQVYARVARGSRSGGLDNNTVAPFAPEFLTETEIGLKAEWFDRRVRTNLAAFWGDYSDVQRSSLVEIPGNPPILIASVTNAAAATLQGVEFEGTAILGAGFTLSGSVGYIDAVYDTYVRRNANGTTSNFSGKPFESPKWTYSTSLAYERPLANDAEFNARVDWTWQDEILNIEFAPLNQPSRGLLNARIAYETPVSAGFDTVEVALWGKNLTDEEYLPAGINFGAGVYNWYRYSEPLTYGVAVKGRF